MTICVVPQNQGGFTRSKRDPLDVFFAPETVAVLGATEAPSSAGRTLMSNLVRYPFGGILFPINPKRSHVLGIKAYPNLAAVPGPVDLAIIATPALTVPDILSECVAAGVQGVIILSAGIGESGPAGADLAGQIRQRLQGGSLRILGPNSLGIACPRTGINATFAPTMVPPGNVGLLSQSGALLSGLLGKDRPERVGCSAFVSVGSLLDITWSEWIDYLAKDPQSECIGIYLETLGDAPSFFAAVRRVVRYKPVILVKGRAPDAAFPADRWKDEVFEEACRCNGVLRVHRLADLFRIAEMVTTQTRLKGRRLTILSNARSLGLLAADALRHDGGTLAPLAPETVARLEKVLTAPRDPPNPIDVGDDADLEQFAQAATIAVEDPTTAALLVLLTPHATIDPLGAAEHLRSLALTGRLPIIACWMWEASDPGSLSILREAGIPVFRSPDGAIRLFGYLWRYAENQRFLAENSAVIAEAEEQSVNQLLATQIIAGARRSGRTVLTRTECQQLLSVYALPTLKTGIAENEHQAVHLAESFGYPVVVGLTVDMGPLADEAEEIRLKAFDKAAVRRAFHTVQWIAHEHFQGKPSRRAWVEPLIRHASYEFSLRSTIDQEMGPVIQLGLGGRWATLSRDRVIALPPLNPQMIREMIETHYLFTVVRAAAAPKSLDFEALQEFLSCFSRLVVEQRWIKELSINPLLVLTKQVIALDALVVLQDMTLREEQLPRFVQDNSAPKIDLDRTWGYRGPERH